MEHRTVKLTRQRLDLFGLAASIIFPRWATAIAVSFNDNTRRSENSAPALRFALKDNPSIRTTEYWDEGTDTAPEDKCLLRASAAARADVHLACTRSPNRTGPPASRTRVVQQLTSISPEGAARP